MLFIVTFVYRTIISVYKLSIIETSKVHGYTERNKIEHSIRRSFLLHLVHKTKLRRTITHLFTFNLINFSCLSYLLWTESITRVHRNRSERITISLCTNKKSVGQSTIKTAQSCDMSSTKMIKNIFACNHISNQNYTLDIKGVQRPLNSLNELSLNLNAPTLNWTHMCVRKSHNCHSS